MSTPLYEPSEVQSHVWGNCYVWFLQPLAVARCYNPYYPLCTKPHVLSSLQTHFYHRQSSFLLFYLGMTASLHNSLDGTPFFTIFYFLSPLYLFHSAFHFISPASHLIMNTAQLSMIVIFLFAFCLFFVINIVLV